MIKREREGCEIVRSGGVGKYTRGHEGREEWKNPYLVRTGCISCIGKHIKSVIHKQFADNPCCTIVIDIYIFPRAYLSVEVIWSVVCIFLKLVALTEYFWIGAV